MPRILRIINRLNLGGPTYNVAYLSKYLAPEYETMLVSGMKDDSEESSEFIVRQMGLDPIYIPEMKREISLGNDYRALKKIKSIILDFKPDIIHTHAAKAGAIGRLAAIMCRVPVIVHTFHGHVFHSYFGPAKTHFFIQAERYLAKKSSAIIAVSEKQKQELALTYKICTLDQIDVIRLGFDLSKFRENQVQKRVHFRNTFKIADDEVAIGIIGRIVPIKNHTLFIQALKKVLDKTNKKVRAFIIGDGEDRLKMEELAGALNIRYSDDAGTVAPLTFTSWIKEVDQAMAGMDIIALTSLNEGTPVSLIEAQAANKAVVSTRVGGVENIVLHNLTGLLSESGDVETLSDNLLALIQDEKRRISFAANGWENVRYTFHYMRLIEDMKTLYRSLLFKNA